MTFRSPDDRLEQWLKAVYDGRQATPNEELRNRVSVIPTTVRRAGTPWLTLLVSTPILAAAIVVVVGIGVAVLARRAGVVGDVSRGTASAGAAFDPVHPVAGLVALSGVTFDGLRFAVVATFLGVGLAMATRFVVRMLRGTYVERAARTPTRRSRLALLIALLLGGAAAFARPYFPAEALVPGSVAGGGVGLAEIRSDGASVIYDAPGLYAVRMDGPRNVYAVRPGEPLTYVVSVRNALPIGIRLDGRWIDSSASTDMTEPPGSSPTGLGLLRDPNRADGSIENTIAFAPVELAPGQEVALVVAEVGRSCADPTKALPDRSVLGSTGTSSSAPLIQFVYEVLGIRGLTSVPISPEVTVPSNCPAGPGNPVRIDR